MIASSPGSTNAWNASVSAPLIPPGVTMISVAGSKSMPCTRRVRFGGEMVGAGPVVRDALLGIRGVPLLDAVVEVAVEVHLDAFLELGGADPPARTAKCIAAGAQHLVRVRLERHHDAEHVVVTA